MSHKNNVLAIPGSTRQLSSNHRLLKAMGALFVDEINLTIYDGLASLPHFNPDHDTDDAPAPVVAFRQLLHQADGVIICTPEYAHGVPGTLKNAIDWTVSSAGFRHKPTVLITASTDGQYAHSALLETLRVIEAKGTDQLQLLIPFIKAKMHTDNNIKDEKTLTDIKQLMHNFIHTMNM